MKKRHFHIIGLLGLLSACYLNADTRVFQDAVFNPERLANVSDRTWVLVDLDDCLFTSATSWGCNTEFRYILMQCTADHPEWPVPQRLEQGVYPQWLESQSVCNVTPVSQAFVDHLKNLQTRGITVIGVTHRWPCIAEQTLRQLNRMGFQFSSISGSNELQMGNSLLLTRGVLFCKEINKSEGLAFLFNILTAQYVSLPSEIVFFDDTLRNVSDLEVFCRIQEIDYTGVCLREIETSGVFYDGNVAELQRFMWRRSGCLWSDELAKAFLERNCYGPADSE